MERLGWRATDSFPRRPTDKPVRVYMKHFLKGKNTQGISGILSRDYRSPTAFLQVMAFPSRIHMVIGTL